MDFVEHNLISYLHLKNTYFNSILFNIACDVSSGCMYLSENKIIHREIASRNILIEIKSENITAKICDFGIAVILDKKDDKFISTKNDFNLRSSAPECLIENIFTIKSDVWSFGILIREIFTLTRLRPYNDIPDNEVQEYVKSKNIVEIKHTFPINMSGLIRKCCNFEQAERLSFEEINKEIVNSIHSKAFH